MKAPRAFTLIELLIVIAIIAVLAAMLLPTISSVSEKSKAAFCLNNLKQWGIATQVYAVDNNDFLPPEGIPNPSDNDTNAGWYIQLPAIMGLPRYHDMPWRTNSNAEAGRTAWVCPSNARRSNGNNLFHYCLNDQINGTGAANHPVKTSSLARPTGIVWLFDSKNLPAVGTPNYVHTNLHNRGAQFVFLDAHAARFGSVEYWDFVANRGRTNNPELIWTP